jgi:hypothetical protein
MAGIEVEGTEMVHMAVDDLVSAAQGSAWRTLAVLVLLGILSFTAVSDQSNARRECGPFTMGVSPVGGCDWVQ